ncbi:hypothetical protein J5N97_000307 [Dioscorea zingiberensis]|uniref:Uncharacterized protein n=1 Tax=Dioscorea zingiberensis TaxID=325984 RepID=A0A9D5BSY2_9LILI|nr:hypothetical protein J5N97_000307 [Dioscorea zingiberensis]
MAAQMKAFFDSTGSFGGSRSLQGCLLGSFVSTGTQGGGQETNAGGSPYGSGVLSGDGTRAPTETELALAEHHGKYMATIVKKLVH